MLPRRSDNANATVFVPVEEPVSTHNPSSGAMMVSYRVKSTYDNPAKPQAIAEAIDRDMALERAGALAPPYDPETMIGIVADSSALPQNIDGMKTNIHGYGYRLVPVIDPTSEGAKALVRQDIYLRARANKVVLTQRPSDEEVNKYLEILTFQMEMEKAYITSFFRECAGDISFTKLRGKTCKEMEEAGNAWWEVLRDPETQELQGFNYLPTISMRMTEIDPKSTLCSTPYRISDTKLGIKKQYKHFRRYIQEHMGKVKYFKEFGDPRHLDSNTGRFLEEGEAVAEDFVDAHEVIHFKIETSYSPYGAPRWTGNMFGVLGTRAAEEVNYSYFDNNTVGPMALLVSGANVTGDTIKRIEQDIKEMKKGRDKAHDILILAADTNPLPGVQVPQIKMELKNLTGSQMHEGQFMNYVKDNKDALGTTFRQPRIILGQVDGANRAANDAALRFVEQQVYKPIRDEFDDFINRHVLPALGWILWAFVSNSPVATDPETQTKIVQALVAASILTPKEGRREAAKILNTDLDTINEPWVNMPPALYMAQIQQAKVDPPIKGTPSSGEEMRNLETDVGRTSDGSEALQGVPSPLETGESASPLSL